MSAIDETMKAPSHCSCGGEIGPDLAGRPMCYRCGPPAMRLTLPNLPILRDGKCVSCSGMAAPESKTGRCNRCAWEYDVEAPL